MVILDRAELCQSTLKENNVFFTAVYKVVLSFQYDFETLNPSDKLGQIK